MNNSTPLTLHPNRGKWLSIGVFLAIFTVMGVFSIIKNGEFMSWFNTIFFGVCAGISFLNLLPNRVYLRLTQDGFTVRTLTYIASYQWGDVDKFGVTGAKVKKVAILLSPTCRSLSKLRVVDRAVMGYDGVLPDTYGLTAKDLAKLLSEWKSRAKLARPT